VPSFVCENPLIENATLGVMESMGTPSSSTQDPRADDQALPNPLEQLRAMGRQTRSLASARKHAQASKMCDDMHQLLKANASPECKLEFAFTCCCVFLEGPFANKEKGASAFYQRAVVHSKTLGLPVPPELSYVMGKHHISGHVAGRRLTSQDHLVEALKGFRTSGDQERQFETLLLLGEQDFMGRIDHSFYMSPSDLAKDAFFIAWTLNDRKAQGRALIQLGEKGFFGPLGPRVFKAPFALCHDAYILSKDFEPADQLRALLAMTRTFDQRATVDGKVLNLLNLYKYAITLSRQHQALLMEGQLFFEAATNTKVLGNVPLRLFGVTYPTRRHLFGRAFEVGSELKNRNLSERALLGLMEQPHNTRDIRLAGVSPHALEMLCEFAKGDYGWTLKYLLPASRQLNFMGPGEWSVFLNDVMHDKRITYFRAYHGGPLQENEFRTDEELAAANTVRERDRQLRAFAFMNTHVFDRVTLFGQLIHFAFL